ncbi:hypothetical protein HPB50_028140 [Hyalomma asiaticum]|nr:hypothetical protein HPB50_028140 [Hyalomma asiaticum]
MRKPTSKDHILELLDTDSVSEGGLEKRVADTRSKTRTLVNAARNGNRVRRSGRGGFARSNEQDHIAGVPFTSAADIMESKLVVPDTATIVEAALVSPCEVRFGAVDARFAVVENQESIMVTAKRETISAILAQQLAHTSRPARKPSVV